MPSERFSRRWLYAAATVLLTTGCGDAGLTGAPSARAADARPAAAEKRPASPEDAAKAIDLRVLPLYPGSEEPGARSIARLTYTASGAAADVFAFHKKELAERKWKELPGGYSSPESASGTFQRDGFTLTLSATSMGGAADKPQSMVNAVNLGNVQLEELPVPPDSTKLYSFPASAAYVTPNPVDATAAALAELLAKAGWEPYGTAGDSRFYKQNAIRLTATVGTAPAQGGKTTIQLSAEQMSADLPAPADGKNVHYSELPTQLAVDYPGDLQQADAWYREHLTKRGWKPTTEKPVKAGFEHFVIFRNEAGGLLEIKFRAVDDLTRLILRYMTPEEFAEMERRWDEKQKQEAASGEAAP
jgi:hypothetical protein